MTATVHLLQLEAVSGHALSVVLGHWTWHLLLRRPAFAALQHSYTFIIKYGTTPHPLWYGVRRELLLLMSLSPALQSSLRAPVFETVIATDASSTGAGVVISKSAAQLADQLWPLALDLQRVECPVTVDNTLSIDMPIPSSLASDLIQVHDSLSLRHWTTIISSQWRYQDEHINSLELRAVLLAVRWILSHNSTTSIRTFLLVDSSVVYYVLRKGRSSSRPLLSVYRRLAAFLLAADMYLIPCWVPSERNPADNASRLFSNSHD